MGKKYIIKESPSTIVISEGDKIVKTYKEQRDFKRDSDVYSALKNAGVSTDFIVLPIEERCQKGKSSLVFPNKGVTLSAFFKNNEYLSVNETDRIILMTIWCLIHLNEKGFAHIDVKEDNFVISQSLNVRMIDAGFISGKDPWNPEMLTIWAKTDYCSPEIREMYRKLYHNEKVARHITIDMKKRNTSSVFRYLNTSANTLASDLYLAGSMFHRILTANHHVNPSTKLFLIALRSTHASDRIDAINSAFNLCVTPTEDKNAVEKTQ